MNVANKAASQNEGIIDVMPVIKNFVALKKKEAKLKALIEAAKEEFYAAASAIDANGMEIAGARIELSKTASKWDYPPRIVKAEDAVKELKKNYQETHDPNGGGEPVWKVVTKA